MPRPRSLRVGDARKERHRGAADPSRRLRGVAPLSAGRGGPDGEDTAQVVLSRARALRPRPERPADGSHRSALVAPGLRHRHLRLLRIPLGLRARGPGGSRRRSAARGLRRSGVPRRGPGGDDGDRGDCGDSRRRPARRPPDERHVSRGPAAVAGAAAAPGASPRCSPAPGAGASAASRSRSCWRSSCCSAVSRNARSIPRILRRRFTRAWRSSTPFPGASRLASPACARPLRPTSARCTASRTCAATRRCPSARSPRPTGSGARTSRTSSTGSTA